MARILSEPPLKQVTCKSCKAIIGYLPEEVETYSGRDWTGGPDGYERVKCPRPGCIGHGYINTW